MKLRELLFSADRSGSRRAQDVAVFDGLAARHMAWTRRRGEYIYPYDCDPSYGE